MLDPTDPPNAILGGSNKKFKENQQGKALTMRRLFWLFFINNNNHLICKCPRQFIEYSLVDIRYVPYWANGRPIKMLVGNAYTKLGYRVWHSNESEDFVLNCFYHFNLVLGYGFPSGSGVHLALSGGFGGTARPFMPHRCLFTRPTWARTTPPHP